MELDEVIPNPYGSVKIQEQSRKHGKGKERRNEERLGGKGSKRKYNQK